MKSLLESLLDDDILDKWSVENLMIMKYWDRLNDQKDWMEAVKDFRNYVLSLKPKKISLDRWNGSSLDINKKDYYIFFETSAGSDKVFDMGICKGNEVFYKFMSSPRGIVITQKYGGGPNSLTSNWVIKNTLYKLPKELIPFYDLMRKKAK